MGSGIVAKTPGAPSESWGPWIALAVLDLSLFANQYVTLRRLKRFVLERTADQPTESIQTGAVGLVLERWREVFTPIDLVIAVLVLLALAYLVYAEITRRALTGILIRAQTSRHVRYGLLALGALAMARCYLSPGRVFMGDSEAHTIRTWMVAENVRNLQMPVWSNYWYGGYPMLGSYAPLFFWVTAPLALVLGDVHLATKLVLWSAHVASIFFMFWFLREATKGTPAAILGAFAYGLAFHRAHIILYRGDLNLSLVFVLYPILFLMVERYRNGRGKPRTAFLVFSLALAGLILNHHGYGFFGSVLAGLYLAVRIALTPIPWRERGKGLAFFGLAAISAGVISAFSLVPYVLDAHLARGMREAPFEMLIPNLQVPLLLYQRFFRSPIYYMFRWTVIGDAGNIGYVGLSIGVFALVAVPFVVRRRSPPGIALVACALTSLLMMRNFIDFNIKNTNFFLFFLSALAAFSVGALESPAAKLFQKLKRTAAHVPETLTVILLGVLLVDLGPTTFQSAFREDHDFRAGMFSRIQDIDGNYKVVDRRLLKYVPGPDQERYYEPGSLGVANAHDRIFTPLGRFHEGANKSFGYNAEMVKNLQRDLHHDTISELSLVGMYLMGVKYVTFRHRYAYYSPALEPSPRFNVKDGLLTLKEATPLIASRRVVSATVVEGYDPDNIIEARQYFDPETYDHGDRRFREIVVPIIERMKVDVKTGVADVLIAHPEEQDFRSLVPSEDTPQEGLEIEVRQFSANINTVTVGYRSNMEAVGRLAYSYFPYLVVELDGKPTRFFRSAMSYILLPLPAGEHVVKVHAVPSPSQKWSFLVSSSFLVSVLVLAYRRRSG